MLKEIIRTSRSGAVPVLRDARGAAAIFFAIVIIPLIGGVGLAVDSSLGYLLRSRMMRSLDAAGLAAAQADETQTEAVARAFFDANFGIADKPEKVGKASVTLTQFAVTTDTSTQRLILTAEAQAPTVFMRVFGQDSMTVSARSVIQRENRGAEIALVLDSSGFLSNSEMQSLQEAALGFVETLYSGSTTQENLWMSVVPFTATVNVGSRIEWLDPGDRAVARSNVYKKEGWKGCVRARGAPEDTADAPPSEIPFAAFFYDRTKRSEDNKWPPIADALSDGWKAHGPNLGCASPIQSLAASQTAIKAAISQMDVWPRGGSMANLGLVWGWRTLSPRWRGTWEGETPRGLPLDYGAPMMKKIVIVVSASNNEFYDHDTGADTPGSDYTAYGRLEDSGATSLKEGRNMLEERMLDTCTAMKAKGIKIYALLFGSRPDGKTQNLYRSCASSQETYFKTSDGTELRRAFGTVGGQLSNLRVAE